MFTLSSWSFVFLRLPWWLRRSSRLDLDLNFEFVDERERDGKRDPVVHQKWRIS